MPQDVYADEIRAVTAMRDARTRFMHEVRAAALEAMSTKIHANEKSKKAFEEDVLAELSGEPAFLLAEFFFLILAAGISSVEDVTSLIKRHNVYVETLLSDSEKRKRMGLDETRVRRAAFDKQSTIRFVGLWHTSPGSIDQSNLARLLFATMSAETVRKTVIAFTEANFLKRDAKKDFAVVRSTGSVEQIYRRYARAIHKEISSKPASPTSSKKNSPRKKSSPMKRPTA